MVQIKATNESTQNVTPEALTPEELAIAIKVFGTLAKWKRELQINKNLKTNHTLPVNSNSDLIENPNQPMQK